MPRGDYAMKARLVVGLAFLLGAFVAAPVGAGVPDAAHSFVAPRVVICPAGDSMLVVIVRHASGNPWAEGPVWADLCDCPGVRLSTIQPCGIPDTSACHVTLMPDLNGVVEIPIAGGGLCPGGTARVYADGVLLAIRPEPACFDQNGDLKVDGADVAIVNSKIGTHDPGADFDGDGTVTPADLAILLSHLGHAAPDAAASAAAGRR
jgi:hypothetical protein